MIRAFFRITFAFVCAVIACYVLWFTVPIAERWGMSFAFFATCCISLGTLLGTCVSAYSLRIDDGDLRQKYRKDFDALFIRLQQMVFDRQLGANEPGRLLSDWTEESVCSWIGNRGTESNLFIEIATDLRSVNTGLKRLYSPALRGWKRRKVLRQVDDTIDKLKYYLGVR